MVSKKKKKKEKKRNRTELDSQNGTKSLLAEIYREKKERERKKKKRVSLSRQWILNNISLYVRAL